MAKREGDILKEIQIDASESGARLMRNNVAKGWIGEHTMLQDGSVLIKNPRRLIAGLGVGSSDLIGWTPTVITPDMVGQTVAIFTGVEGKTRTGRLTVEQVNFGEQVKKAGGIYKVCRSVEDWRNG